MADQDSTNPAFKDHFSAQAAEYRRYRPDYPPALIEWVAALAPAPGLALDLATGNGQAAVALAQYFTGVRATDLSAAQLAEAAPHPRVSYVLEPAEQVGVPDATFDLAVAAQAAHWFDFGRWAAEMRRVLKPGGAVAIWTYEKFRGGRRIDALVDRFYSEVVGQYWPPERRHVEQGYRSVPFPFDEVTAPAFELVTHWDATTALNYLGTWSSVVRYREARGEDPLALFEPVLHRAWGDGLVELRWPIHLRAGHV